MAIVRLNILNFAAFGVMIRCVSDSLMRRTIHRTNMVVRVDTNPVPFYVLWIYNAKSSNGKQYPQPHDFST